MSASLSQPFAAHHFENLPHVPCVTLYTRNGRVGCGTFDRGVATGRMVHWSAVVASNDDGVSTMPSMPPYVAVVEEYEYTSDTVDRLVAYSNGYVAGDEYGAVELGGPLRGLLVLASNNHTEFRSTSPEPSCPQGDSSPSVALTVGSSYEWNVNNNDGDGLTVMDMYGLPTAYVYNVSTSDYLRGIAKEQGESILTEAVFPAVLSEFNYYMGPSVHNGSIATSQTCLQWKDTDGTWNPKCLPLGGNTIWSVAGSPLPLAYATSNDKPVILLATSMDSTSMFHELSPGANSAASNILALLLAAELIGTSISDDSLDQLYGQIVFAFFQGESYGYIGSRRFLKDLQGFTCQDGNEGVPSVYKRKEESTTVRACLHPIRADLSFQNLNGIRGMIAVDQVGNLGGNKKFYVQGGETTASNDNGFAAFLEEVMTELSTNEYTVQASSVSQKDQDGVYPLPPTPLTSFVQLSGSNYGGVVLSGYDDAYIANSLYHSHLDSKASGLQSIDPDAIASAATILARTAVAAAYQDANQEIDAATAAAYAVNVLPNSVSSSSERFQNLFKCLFEDGNCETFLNYGSVERKNDAERTGLDLGLGQPLGTPPSYYVGIYDANNGQAFIRAGTNFFGSLVAENATEVNGMQPYGKDPNDAFLLRPSLLEMSIFGLMNDFLGRGSFVNNDENASQDLVKCESTAGCSSVDYCSTSSSSLAIPTCAGGVCICGSRSHYHPALDEALIPAKNSRTSFFEIQAEDAGISALYTEPFWSQYVKVRIYNDAGKAPGIWASSMGATVTLLCVGMVLRLKKRLEKEKVY